MEVDIESTAIITYGSLLDPAELEKEYDDVSYTKIRLDGYCRHFAQKGTYREGPEGEECVASVSQSQDDWISALLITGLSEEEYQEYVEREKGYKITEVSPNAISFYEDPWDLTNFTNILIPVGNLPVDTAEPVPSYVRACTEGAFKHGDRFGTDFILTTRLEP